MKEKKEQKVVIQHYIPQNVLLNFSNEKGQVYEGLVMEKKSYQTNISNSMAERFTYEHSFIEINLLEKYFKRIEDYLGPALRHIIEIIESNETNPKEIKAIHALVDKYMREFIIYYYRSGALLHEFAHQQKTPEDRVLLLVRKLVSSEYIRRLSETVRNNYSFCIIKSNDRNFLVSDQFISTAALGVKNRFGDVSNRQIGFKQVILLIPLSKNYYAVYYHGKIPSYIIPDKINILHEDQVNEINRIIINNSYLKAVCFCKDSLELSLSKFEFHSPTTFMAGYNSGLVQGAVSKKEIFFYKSDEKIMNFFESNEWLKYEFLERNSICTCGSKKKFKRCHMDLYNNCRRIMNEIENKVDSRNYCITENSTIEVPIDEWSGYVPSTKNSQAK